MALLMDQGLQELAVLHCCRDPQPSFSENPDIYTSARDAWKLGIYNKTYKHRIDSIVFLPHLAYSINIL